jgi:hypothetical protein
MHTGHHELFQKIVGIELSAFKMEFKNKNATQNGHIQNVCSMCIKSTKLANRK